MAEKKATDSGYDYMILIPVILLIALGLVIVYSASSNLAEHRLGDSYFYLKRQALFCVLGIGLWCWQSTFHVPCIQSLSILY